MKVLSGGIIKFIVLLVVGFIALNAILLLASNTAVTLFLFIIPMAVTMVALNYSQLKRLAKGAKKKLYDVGRLRNVRRETQGRLKEIDVLKGIQFYLYGNYDDVVITKKESTITALGFLALKMVPKGFRGDLDGVLKTLHDENISLTYILVQNPSEDRVNHDRLNYLKLHENYWNVKVLIAVHKNMKGFLNLEEKCAILAEEVRKNMFIVKTSIHTSFPECKVRRIDRDNLIKVLRSGIMSGGIDSETGLDLALRESEVANLITEGPIASSLTSNVSSKKRRSPSHLSTDLALRETTEREISDYAPTHRIDPMKPYSDSTMRIRRILLDEDFADDELPLAVEVLQSLLDYPGSTLERVAPTTDINTTLKVLEKLERLKYIISFTDPEGDGNHQRFLLLSKKGEEALKIYSEDHRNISRELVALWSRLMDE